MKIAKILFLALVAASLTFAACSDDEDNTPSGPYLRAKVDGASFEADPSTFTGQAVFNEVVLGGFELNNFASITLDFTENLSVGTYTYDGSVGNEVAAVYYPGGIASASYGDISGSFTILEYDTVANSIKGTFNFVALEAASLDSVNVSEGEFFMEYQ